MSLLGTQRKLAGMPPLLVFVSVSVTVCVCECVCVRGSECGGLWVSVSVSVCGFVLFFNHYSVKRFSKTCDEDEVCRDGPTRHFFLPALTVECVVNTESGLYVW